MEKTKLILLHGWLFDSHVWTNFRDKLSDDYEIYSPDLPGYGDNYLVKNNVIFLNDYIKDINSECVVIGWSYGGLIAKKCMEKNKLIEKIILINSYLPNDKSFISINRIDVLIRELQSNRAKAIKNFIYECCKNSSTPISDMKMLNKDMMRTRYPSNEVLINNLEDLKATNKRDFDIIDSDKSYLIIGENDHFRGTNDPNFKCNVVTINKMGHLPFYSSCENVIISIRKFLSR